MQPLYFARSRLDAQRLRAFLARHEIEAEIRETPVESGESGGEPISIGFSVWVADAQAPAVGDLLSDFQLIRDQSSEYLTPEDVSDDASVVHEAQPARCRVPWLTGLLCLACLIPSVGLWREPRPNSTEALIRWGWRDSLDVADGSYWAVLASVLLHPTVEHLVMNLAQILVLGWAIERACGRACWVALTFAAILVSTAGELAGSGQLGVGASGILFAFYGFTLVASVRQRLLPLWLLVLVSVWSLFLVLLDAASVLDHHLSGRPHDPSSTHAHLAGFGLGLVFAFAFVISWKPRLTRTALACIVAAACVPLQGSPWLPDWLMEKGDREYRQGNLQAAIGWYSRAISRSDHPADAHVRRGQVMLDDAQFDEALADFAAALTLDPKTSNARSLRALIFVLRSDLDNAEDEANVQLQNGQNMGFDFAVRGAIAQARYEFDAATKDFETAINLEPGAANHWVNRALTRFEQCRYEEALADADHALWLDPKDPAALLVRGLVFYDLSQGDRARAEIELAYQLAGHKLGSRPRDVLMHCRLATMQLVLFDIDPAPARLVDAVTHAEQALQLAPRFWIAWRICGRVEFERKDFALAEQHFMRALELNSRDAWAACHLGLTRHELGRFEEAMRDIDRAISLNARFGYAYRSRGLVLKARNDYQGAIGDLTRALELNLRFAEAYQLRGRARLALGDEGGGRNDLRRAAELDAKYAGGDQSGH